MKNESIEKIIGLRQELILKFENLRDYKSNKNAIMREIEYAEVLHKIIVKLDEILKEYVSFKDA